VLTLGRVALALLVAVPAIVALAVVLGVVFVRAGGSPRRASVPVASGTCPGGLAGLSLEAFGIVVTD
jgi:hypothetical protein